MGRIAGVATGFEHACRLGAEGIVSKRIDAPYRSGPTLSLPSFL